MQETKGEAVRTTGQRLRHFHNQMDHLEERKASLELARDAFFAPSRKKFEGWNEKAIKSIAALGLDQRQIDVLNRYGLLAVDNVTGFHEARSGHARFETVTAAINHVIETGERAWYIEMDLKNLGGLNARLGHTGANDIFGKVAGILRLFLSQAAEDAVFFRHGGDEVSAILIASDERRLQPAMQKIVKAVQELAQQFGLQDIPHPKHPGNPSFLGIGVHFGVVEIRPEHASKPQALFQEADVQLEGNKNVSAA